MRDAKSLHLQTSYLCLYTEADTLIYELKLGGGGGGGACDAMKGDIDRFDTSNFAMGVCSGLSSEDR